MSDQETEVFFREEEMAGDQSQNENVPGCESAIKRAVRDMVKMQGEMFTVLKSVLELLLRAQDSQQRESVDNLRGEREEKESPGQERRCRRSSELNGEEGSLQRGQPSTRHPSRVCMAFRDRDQGRQFTSRGVRRADTSELMLPAFTGKENWQVWINRFEIVASRRGWDEETMLDQLLPRLQGDAGDFVFTQLRRSAWSDYDELRKELNSRYRKIETPKTFAAKFARRMQKEGETAEEYAAELKRLYDRAHKSREEYVRQEDLVRRFLDGLRDYKARFEVEFHKEPEDIDDAVYHVVNFVQTRRHNPSSYNTERIEGRHVRRIVGDSKDYDCSSSDEETETANTRRVPVKTPAKEQKKTVAESKAETGKEDETESTRLVKQLLQMIEELTAAKNNTYTMDHRSGKARWERRSLSDVTCYNCKKKGHFARECRDRISHNTATSPIKRPENTVL